MATVLLTRNSLFGSIRLHAYVGSGGFSDVYEGFDTEGRRLAVKVFRSTRHEASKREAISRELEIVQRVDSRGVARFVDADLSAEPPWLASEFVDGPSLAEAVEEVGKLSPSITQALLYHLARTISSIHHSGIAHRDLAPTNVLLGPAGPTLIDFGASRFDLEHALTGSQLLVGTEGFVAPETSEGRNVGSPADIYALAKIGFFCLSGKTPPLGTAEDDPFEVFDQEITELLRAACSEDPRQRPSAEILEKALACELTPLDELPRRPRAIKKLPRRFRLRTLIGTSAVALAGITLGVFGLLQAKPDPLSTTDIIGAFSGNSSIETMVLDSGHIRKIPLLPDWEYRRLGFDQWENKGLDKMELGGWLSFAPSFGGTKDRAPESSSFEYLEDQEGFLDFRVSAMTAEVQLQLATIKSTLPSFNQNTQEITDVTELEFAFLDRVADLQYVVFEGWCTIEAAETAELWGDWLIMAARERSGSCHGADGSPISSRAVRMWHLEQNAFIDLLLVKAGDELPLRNILSSLEIESPTQGMDFGTTYRLSDFAYSEAHWVAEPYLTDSRFIAPIWLAPGTSAEFSVSELEDSIYHFVWKTSEGEPVPAGSWYIRTLEPEWAGCIDSEINSKSALHKCSEYDGRRLFTNPHGDASQGKWLYLYAQPNLVDPFVSDAEAKSQAVPSLNVRLMPCEEATTLVASTDLCTSSSKSNLAHLFNSLDEVLDADVWEQLLMDPDEWGLPNPNLEFDLPTPTREPSKPSERIYIRGVPVDSVMETPNRPWWWTKDDTEHLWFHQSDVLTQEELARFVPDTPRFVVMDTEFRRGGGDPWSWLDAPDLKVTNCDMGYFMIEFGRDKHLLYLQVLTDCLLSEVNLQGAPLIRYLFSVRPPKTGEPLEDLMMGEFVPSSTSEWVNFVNSISNTAEYIQDAFWHYDSDLLVAGKP